MRGTNARSWNVSACHAKRLIEEPSISKILLLSQSQDQYDFASINFFPYNGLNWTCGYTHGFFEQ